MSSKNKHILEYKPTELNKKIIDKNSQSKFFFRKIYRKKIYNKVYTNYDGIDSKKSEYITLKQSFEKIHNLGKKLEKILYNELNWNNLNEIKTNYKNQKLIYIPFIVDCQYLEIYVRFTDDIFSDKKLLANLEGKLHVIGENGIYITYRNKKYLFIV